jgi:hypothetical protein
MTTPGKQDIASLKGSGLFDAEQYLETLNMEADGLSNQLAAAEEARLALEADHEKALKGAEQNLEAVHTEADGLRNQLAAAEEARLAQEADHEKAIYGAEQNLEMNRDSLQPERTTRFSETAALTRMSEDLWNEVTQLKSEIENERRTRFSESAILTRMIEELKAEKAR